MGNNLRMQRSSYYLTKNRFDLLLWGNYAKQKGAIIDRSKHHVLTAAHPHLFRPATVGLVVNILVKRTLLRSMGKEPIAWTPA